jgi:hypothetical protein
VLVLFRSILLITRHLYEKKVNEKIKISILCLTYTFQKSRRLYNVEKYGTTRQAKDDTIKGDVRCPCWITEATETHSEYVILLVFAQQQWLRGLASMLSLYVRGIACLF